jgi:hypothetical protein
VNSKEEDFCPNYVQEFCLCGSLLELYSAGFFSHVTKLYSNILCIQRETAQKNSDGVILHLQNFLLNVQFE